jgi:hypothetical protein
MTTGADPDATLPPPAAQPAPAAATSPTARRNWTGGWVQFDPNPPRPWNQYELLRRTFDLAGDVRSATLRVTADARYVLYVNGRYVHTGPARSYPTWQSFDEIDVAPFLKVGRNAICAIVHQFGVPTYVAHYAHASGFLCDGEVVTARESIPLHTPAGWRQRRGEGWKQNVDRTSFQMGWQEHYDAGDDPADWLSPGYDATDSDGWRDATLRGPVPTHPWLVMEERGVPLLKSEEVSFAKVVAEFTGEDGRGHKVAENIAQFVAAEERAKATDAVHDAANLLRDDDHVAVVEPADGHFKAIALELPSYRTGHFTIDVADAAGDEIIDVVFAEAVEKTGWPVLSKHCSASLRYRCRAGPQAWRSFAYYGMKYVAVVFRNVEKSPLKVRHLGVTAVTAGLEQVGRFECSDATLNKVWQAAVHTQRNCAFDAFVDCPWREQAMWWGDAHVQARVTAHAFGDTSLLARGIELVKRSQQIDGSLHAHPPAMTPKNRLPDFMLTWVGSVLDHYELTGGTEVLKRCLPALDRLLGFFADHADERGLIGRFTGFWVFLDWKPLRKDDFSGVLNLQYLRALQHAARIYEIAGQRDKADAARFRAQALAATLTDKLWDADASLLRDGIDPATGEAVDDASQHAAALAILAGLVPEHHEKLARTALLKPATAWRTKVITASIFFYAYVLEAMARAGLKAEAVQIVKDLWGPIVDAGADTLPEGFETVTGSFCHAWSAHPVYHLMQIVLGVTREAPGWTKARIAPCTCGLEFARGAVPTPHGLIEVEWEQADPDQLVVKLEIPQAIEATFVDPLGNERELTPGSHQFHT